MPWISIIWLMIATVSMTLGVIQLLVWMNQRDLWASLLFFALATSVAAFAVFELLMMRAETAEQMVVLFRWYQIPVLFGLSSMGAFVRVYLRAGKPWLAWTVVSMRLLILVPNFTAKANFNYREITAVRHIQVLGETVSVAVGVPNPWMTLGHVSLLLWLYFVADATITVWRRGDRQRALMVGGSFVFFVAAGVVQAMLLLWGFIVAPLMVSAFYIGIILSTSYEMAQDLLHATRLARELRESEQRMTLAADAAKLGIWIRDLVRNEIWASDNWRALFGFEKAEPLNLERCLQKFHPEDREIVQQAWANAIVGNGNYATEYRVVLSNGQVRWIGSRGRTEFNAQRKPVLMRGVSIDITERKRVEIEVQRQQNELAHLSRVTTLSALSNSLAHELNQPLAIILTNAQAAQRLLAQQPPDLAEAQDILTDIVNEDQRAGEVIRRLRSMLKLGEPSRQPLNVNEIIEEVLQISRHELIEQNITIHRTLAQNLPQIPGDHIQLEQILLNLILNARDAMAANLPADRHLTLTTAQRDAYVRVSISDTGCGLPSDTERMFAPFYTTKKQGLGLGLAICRSIAADHRGRLWVEAPPGAGHPPGAPTASAGATFHLELPVAAEVAT